MRSLVAVSAGHVTNADDTSSEGSCGTDVRDSYHNTEHPSQYDKTHIVADYTTI